MTKRRRGKKSQYQSYFERAMTTMEKNNMFAKKNNSFIGAHRKNCTTQQELRNYTTVKDGVCNTPGVSHLALRLST